MTKVLVANRGEIAARIFRTLREMGLKSVAVYSEADRRSPYLRLADEAYPIGAPEPSQSYLNIEKILKVAEKSGATLVHPGYGFLSENAAFSKACTDAGLGFVGPDAKTIDLMGDKVASRKQAKEVGVPLNEGSEPVASATQALEIAKKIGFPVLLKAKAGGGGKGMRRVDSPDDVAKGFNMAQSEAQNAFGDGAIYVEKCLIKPRHVEVQVFGCSDGRILIFGNRDCSMQRRHQKIIEEAPAPELSTELCERMAEASRKLAKSVNYQGAGTIEYLVDSEENFFFLEMNTRLQVEHPVTEWVTGVDLVKMQILTALKKDSSFSEPSSLLGHSIEVRLYAEDPDNNFFPAPGTVQFVDWPQGPGIRIDSGIENGFEINLFYDPMIAKLSVWAPSREEALERMKRALRETKIVGVKTNLSFLRNVIESEAFTGAKLSTTFIEDHGAFDSEPVSKPKALMAAAMLARQATLPKTAPKEKPDSGWWKSGVIREA